VLRSVSHVTGTSYGVMDKSPLRPRPRVPHAHAVSPYTCAVPCSHVACRLTLTPTSPSNSPTAIQGVLPMCRTW
jgi:hypothetical protein